MKNSIFKAGYLEACRKYCPSLEIGDGIRTSSDEGRHPRARFLFPGTARMLHVCNAPSPVATSAIPIGEMIAGKIVGR
jgi:L-2-hydroxyglutarate oxidase